MIDDEFTSPRTCRSCHLTKTVNDFPPAYVYPKTGKVWIANTCTSCRSKAVAERRRQQKAKEASA